ncbi:hypothetical protein Ancab_009784 [Ancistrocladus abbreviatus]
MEATKAPHVKKGKKKQVKDELDRIKQAEKKRRRLEKALATSAAIRSELEKKKQKKKEEQQRLDEEGAAIAEAVALHVLLGEDSDGDSSNLVVKKDEEFNPWHCAANIGLIMDNRRSALSNPDLKKRSFQGIRCITSAYGYGSNWNHLGEENWSPPSRPLERSFHVPYFEDGRRASTDISPGLIAAQAVSSLQIADDTQVDAVFFNGY